MKKFIAIFALFMLVKPIIPVLEYIVFYDYIKNELCVNKANKALHCDGKCHLKKELAKASEGSEKQDKNSGRSFSVESNLVYFQEFGYLKFNGYLKTSLPQPLFYYTNLYTHLATGGVFHPPLLA